MTPENLQAIHDEHARELLASLRDLDAVLDARRLGVEPATGRTPINIAGELRLRKLLDKEAARLNRWWKILLSVYADAFGAGVADAFGQAVRAWHAGIELADQNTPAVSFTPGMATQQVQPASLPARMARQPHRIIARLPAARPLRDAVAAGRFGKKKNGKPVCPSLAEIRKITAQRAEKLIELLDSIACASAKKRPDLESQFRNELEGYAEDFGHDAARQLEVFVRRQAGLCSGRLRGR